MVMSHGANVETVTPDYSESIESLVNLIAPNHIHKFVTDIDEAIPAIDQNANPRLAVEHLMLVMPQAQQLI
jgi:hypothetical protein